MFIHRCSNFVTKTKIVILTFIFASLINELTVVIRATNPIASSLSSFKRNDKNTCVKQSHDLTFPNLSSQISRGGGATTQRGSGGKCSAESIAISASSCSAATNGIKNFLASGLAAACSKTLLAPFDTIKTMQQQVKSGPIASSSINGINSALKRNSLGFFEAANLVMSRPKGFFELYAGLGVSAIGAMPSVGLYFGIYSYSKNTIGPFLKRQFGGEGTKRKLSDSIITTVTIASSAAIGNTIASFSRVPYEVIKQKLQTGEYASTFVAMSDMFKTNGIAAFFPMGGISIQMVRDIPYAIFTLLSYEYLRDKWVRNSGDSIKRPWKDMVAGGLAGGIGSFLTNPFDVIKTRLQIDPELYRGSILVCSNAIYEEGGPSAFLRGSVPRLMHKIPANAVFFIFYELFRAILQVQDVTEN